MPSEGPIETQPDGILSLTGFRAWVGGIIGVSLIFALQPFYPNSIGAISNILPAACATTAFVSSLSCMRRYGFRWRLNFEVVWFMLTIGMGLWAIAEGTWSYYYFVLKVDVPFPSVADIFYMGGYVPIIAALLGYLDTFHEGLTRRRLGIAVLAIGLAAVLVFVFVLPIELAESASLWQFLVDMLYPVLDLTLVSLAILALAIFVGGRLARWWMLFGAAAALYVIGDEFFLFQIARGTYYNGSYDDLIFLLGYLTFALAFYAHRKEF
ncbi:MAG TPA: hypothetical protein VEC08_01610 [Nitrososphaerales archaeon]|nr:hypothetical protein [Nitrososphaerales archaeon]